MGAWQNQDIEKMKECFHPFAQFKNAMTNPPNEEMRKLWSGWSGIDGFLEWIKLFEEHAEITSVQFKDIVGNDEIVYHARVFEGKKGGKQQPRTVAHQKLVCVDGKIIYGEETWDTAAHLDLMNA